MIPEFILLILGLLVLAKASDFTITNSIKFSKASGINEMTVGFILIAISTSVPELSIGIMSSMSGNGALSLGNIIGADVINICLVFGILAMMGMKIDKKDVDELIYAFVLVSIVALFMIFMGTADMAVGIFLIIIFLVFSKALLDKGVEIKHAHDGHAHKQKFAILAVVGVFLVILSSRFVTDQALLLSSHLNLSQTLLGATILSLGTTMPELSVGIAALRRKNVDLAVGDGIGSIVANITVILGTAAIINPIEIDMVAKIALVFLIFASWMFVFIAKEIGFDKKTGAMLLMLYAFYIIMMLRLA